MLKLVTLSQNLDLNIFESSNSDLILETMVKFKEINLFLRAAFRFCGRAGFSFVPAFFLVIFV